MRSILAAGSGSSMRAWLPFGTAIVLLACVTRLYAVTTPVLWLDEAYSVTLAEMPPAQILLHVSRDVHPPLYYLLLHYWIAMFGHGLLAVRGLSVLCGSLAVVVAMLIAARLANHRAALIVGVMLALLPVAVRYSQETRMYALLGLLLLAATLMLLQWVLQPDRREYLLGYVLFITAGLYTHYFTMLCVAAHWSYLMIICRSHGGQLIRSRAWWSSNVMIALAYSPWLPSFWGQLAHTSWVEWLPAVTLTTVPSTLWSFLTLNDGQHFPQWLFWTFPLAVLSACIGLLVTEKRPSRPVLLICLFSFLPLLLAWLGSYAMPLYYLRFLSYCANGLPILIGLMLEKAVSRSRLGLVLLAACLVVQVAALCRLYDGQINTNGSDWRQARLDNVFEQVNQLWRPGDLIVVNHDFWYYSSAYYNATGVEPLVFEMGLGGDNTGTSPFFYGWKSLIYPRSEQLYVADLQALSAPSGRIWWVGVTSQSIAGQSWPRDWTRLQHLRSGTAYAILFAQSKAAEGQAATSLCGSKLSARAICHMRE